MSHQAGNYQYSTDDAESTGFNYCLLIQPMLTPGQCFKVSGIIRANAVLSDADANLTRFYYNVPMFGRKTVALSDYLSSL